MKRKIFAGIYIILIVLCGFLLFRYIFYYNRANHYYERTDYVGAMEKYDQALTANPMHVNECSIRINLALAMIFNMGEDFAEPENVTNSINTLLAAKEVLLEEDCATLADDGHSETAEQLKREIDELIKKLLEQQASSGSSDESEEPAGGAGSSMDEETEQSIQQQLQQMQNSATQERQENLQFMEEWGQEVNFDIETDIW